MKIITKSCILVPPEKSSELRQNIAEITYFKYRCKTRAMDLKYQESQLSYFKCQVAHPVFDSS